MPNSERNHIASWKIIRGMTWPLPFHRYLGELFTTMKDGGEFLMRRVSRFNGGLYDHP
jgi:hypothetical protein